MNIYVNRRNAAKIVLICATSALGACTQLLQQAADKQITQLSEQHRYVTALATLDQREKNNPDYEQKRATILDAAKSYQSELLKQATALIQQQQFAKAQALIDADRSELPASDELTRFQAQATTARNRYAQRWLDDLVQMRAAALAKEHKAYLAIAPAATTPELQQAVARHQADVDYFMPLIIEAANRAQSQKDFAKAAQYFAIANQLKPSPELAQQLKSSERSGSSNRQKQKTTRVNEREQRYRELYGTLGKSVHNHEFFAGRDLLAQARALDLHDDELDAMQRELDESIANYVNGQIDSGNRAYADGHIEEALQEWRSASSLIPTSELQEKIDKAQKFLDRLHQLQKQSSAVKENNGAGNQLNAAANKYP